VERSGRASSAVGAQHIAGVHVTQVFALPSGDAAELAGSSEADLAALKRLQWFYENMSAYQRLQQTQPQNLAFALADSPVGSLRGADSYCETMPTKILFSAT